MFESSFEQPFAERRETYKALFPLISLSHKMIWPSKNSDRVRKNSTMETERKKQASLLFAKKNIVQGNGMFSWLSIQYLTWNKICIRRVAQTKHETSFLWQWLFLFLVSLLSDWQALDQEPEFSLSSSLSNTLFATPSGNYRINHSRQAVWHALSEAVTLLNFGPNVIFRIP